MTVITRTWASVHGEQHPSSLPGPSSEAKGREDSPPAPSSPSAASSTALSWQSSLGTLPSRTDASRLSTTQEPVWRRNHRVGPREALMCQPQGLPGRRRQERRGSLAPDFLALRGGQQRAPQRPRAQKPPGRARGDRHHASLTRALFTLCGILTRNCSEILSTNPNWLPLRCKNGFYTPI